MELDPQTSCIRLEGNAGSLAHHSAWGVATVVHSHRVLLEEHGEQQDSLLQRKLLANAPAQTYFQSPQALLS